MSGHPESDVDGGVRTGVDTGRLRTGLSPEAHSLVYDQYLPGSGSQGLTEELRVISTVDRAHLVMLAERGIVDPVQAARLLAGVEELRADDFAAVRDLPIPRGVYLAYERHLADTLGEDVGGILHTGRSRNDLNATTVRLRARERWDGLLAAVAELAHTLLERAGRYDDVTMPAYTHGQPAVPITYGHYLAGVAAAVLRALEDLGQAGSELESSPLGAGAVGGTSVPVDMGRTAELLGFAGPVLNSVDAVASREFVLRLLGACAVLGAALSRLARDLSTWSGDEYGLVHIADDLVGSSSMMPQKRNPFLLEHIQGRATAATGHFVAAAAAMATTGYTNAIAVGTEAVRQLWPGLKATTDAVVLTRLVVAGTAPVADRMRRRCDEGYTTATHLAERLVSEGVPFRTAHHQVGQAVLASLTDGVPLTESLGGRPVPSPAEVAEAAAYGAGPGGGGVRRTVRELASRLRRSEAVDADRRARWEAAGHALDKAADALLDRLESPTAPRRATPLPPSNPQDS